MKFSTGLFDSLFGEKLTIEIPQPDGTAKKRVVTRRWLEKMEGEGKIHPVTAPVVKVHMLGLVNYTVEKMIVGDHIDQATYERFRDPETGDIYATTLYEDGKEVTYFLKKERWMELKEKLDRT